MGGAPKRSVIVGGLAVWCVFVLGQPLTRAGVTRAEVEQAIRAGVSMLKEEQQNEGGWTGNGPGAVGNSALATLALVTAGEPVDSPHVARALEFLRQFGPDAVNNTYAIAVQTMAFGAASPTRDIQRMAANAEWLALAQAGPQDRNSFPGMWTYSLNKKQRPDNSNTQYGILGLKAASDAGIRIPQAVWDVSRDYWLLSQRGDGGWNYQNQVRQPASASMTCAGISSLVITGIPRQEGLEVLQGDSILHCGEETLNPSLERALAWLANNFQVDQNVGLGRFKHYYLYGLERVGRLTGRRYIGNHDWYQEGAEELIRTQDKARGFWDGAGESPLIATSFALLFLAKGRAPVLVNKLRHQPLGDWERDADDVRNLVELVSNEKKTLLTWQIVDPNFASVDEMLLAPIAFLNGHGVPAFTADAKARLRDYVEQGGFILADACCGRRAFDQGFRDLMKEVFPEPEYALRPLEDDHPVWRVKHQLEPANSPLWGIDFGCRTAVMYSPADVSCYWNQMKNRPDHVRVGVAAKLGQNIVEYAIGGETPADKLEVRRANDLKAEVPRLGALRIAKLRHAGDWNVAPLAIPNLATALRDQVGLDVVINQKVVTAADPDLVSYPLLYMHGRSAFTFDGQDLERLRAQLEPGGGLLFADAACGSAAFDAAFRRFVEKLLPDRPLVPIPRDDPIYSKQIAFDLSQVQYSKSAGGRRGFPELEGVKLDGHWSIVYSKYDIGCALERHLGPNCKGYSHESAVRIAANIVVFSTLP